MRRLQVISIWASSVLIGALAICAGYALYGDQKAPTTALSITLITIIVIATIIFIIFTFLIFISLMTWFFIKASGKSSVMKRAGYPTYHMVWKELQEQMDEADSAVLLKEWNDPKSPAA